MKHFTVKLLITLLALMICFSLWSNAKTIYVNQAPPTNNNDGKYWISAYKSLQSALDAAVSGDQIWVAKGTYYPSSAYSLPSTSSRYYHFEMKAGVAIYGGFAGNETALDQRTVFGLGETNETILSGDIGTLGDNSDNCYHVIYNPNGLPNSAMLDGFTISGGNADGSNPHNLGGGMYNYSSSPILSNITFTSNKAKNGGGMANYSSSPKLTHVKFISNQASFGGGMCNTNSSPTITNALFISNTASTYGGGIYFYGSSSPVLNNVTLTLNKASSYGGGINSYNSTPTLNNCIIWGNTAVDFGNQIYIDYGSVTLNHSCYSNVGYDVFKNGGTLTATNNNITSNPQFVDAGNGNYQLSKGSPCIDAGNNSYNSEAYDIRGKGFLRKTSGTNHIQTGTIDMGAYEYIANTTIYVNASATGSNNGTSWTNAYKSLQSALEVAMAGDQIWVAKGTYKPSSANGLGTVTRLYHFRMVEGVAIYGGFAGTETSISQRTSFGYTETNETVLSGDIDNDGTLTNNCYHVIYNPCSLSKTAIIDGFTITGGNANDMTGGHAWGGGMANYSNGSPTVNNVTFISNYGNNGGGMFNYIYSSPTLNNVSFIGNSSKHGGGMYNWNNSCPVLTNVKFISNTSLGEGGAISTFYNSALTITNGLIVSNSAVRGGGIDCQSSSPLALTNVTIAANTATDDAGGVCCNSSATFNNCILWGNTSLKLFPDMDIFSGNTVTMNYSCYSTKLYDIGNSGTFNITNHNITTNPVFADAAKGDFRIKKVSPCVDAGFNDYNSLTTDIRGTNYGRKILKTNYLQAGTIDIGAYEYNGNFDTDVDVVIKYVNAAATAGSNNGTSWANAYTSLQTALENANPGDQIWVAKGTYKPSSVYDLPNPTHVIDPTIDPTRYYHFRMKADVAIYGGFAGNEARSYDLSLRDFTTNETILSGDIGTEKDYSDNCCHVIYNPESSALTGTAVLDGFTVTGGYANGNYPHHYGAGMYNDNCSPTISNVIFFDNKTSIKSGSGGGMCNEKSSPRLINVAFTSNKSVTGGGMSNISSSPTLVNVSFTQNGAEYAGGGLYSEHGSVDLTNCTFIGNETYLDCGIVSYGGGMHHKSDLLATLNNVTFNLNKSYKGGGLSFSGNSTVLNNCIIWGNVSTFSGDDIYLSKGVATLNHSCYSNSDKDLYTEDGASFAFDENCITTDPKFIDVTKGDCRIDDESPCIDKGNNSYNSTNFDIRGQARIQNSTIDIGAYEWTDGLDYICTDPTDGGEIASDQSICLGAKPTTITSVSIPTGNKGSLEYQWQSSTTSETEGFSDITDANNETYTPGALSQTTWFRRLARASCMDNWDGAIASNVVTVEVVVVTNPYDAVAENTFTYDGTTKTVVVNINADEKIEWYDDDFNTYTELSGTNAGTYSLYPTVINVDHGCIIDEYKAINLIINKADVTVTPNASQSKIYGDDDPTITYTYTPELVTGNTYSGSLTRIAGENAGNYGIAIGTLSAGNNYKITLAEANFSVTPKPVTVTPDIKTKVYGEADPSLSYTIAPSLLGADAITGVLSRAEGENVGSYDINIGTLTAGGNYEISVVDIDFTITPKTVTVIPNEKLSKVYGSNDPTLDYTFTPTLLSGNTFTGALARESGENVGNYGITIGTLSAGNNYTIALSNVDFTITPLAVSVTADAVSKIYGTPDPILSYTVSPALVNGDSFTGNLSRVSGESVGTYSIIQNNLSLSANYSLTFVENTITIIPLSITVTANAHSKSYGDTDPTLTYSVSPNLVGNDTFTGFISRNNGENVGSYDINQNTLTLNSNYILSFVGNIFTINPKEISIVANPKTKEYGEVDPVLTYTSSPALLGGDTFNGTLDRAVGENVGIYPINIGTLNAGTNYTLLFTSSDFSITPKSIAVFAEAKSKNYGDADPELTYTTSTSLANGNTFAGVLSRQIGENVGLYPITIGNLSAGSNYSINFTSANLEIVQKQLATTAPILTTVKQYDGTNVAKVTAGNLIGVIASDEGNVTISAQAYYDNSSIGINKTITVSYTINGSGSANYLSPSDYIVYNGVICDKTTISKIESLEPGCEGGLINIAYTVLSGEPAEYRIVFDNPAIAAGFSDTKYAEMPANSESGTISFSIPEGIAHGTYTAKLQLRNSIGAESELYPFTFSINLSSDFLVEKFDDIILCNNSSNLFSTYQWYKDNTPINGATKQYYCDPQGLSGSYYVQVTTTNGETLKTCPANFSKKLVKRTGITVYPNPAISGQQFAVEISGVTEEDLTGAILHVYNMQGIEVYKTNHVGVLNYLKFNNQYGNYIIRIITTKGKTLNGKMTLTN